MAIFALGLVGSLTAGAMVAMLSVAIPILRRGVGTYGKFPMWHMINDIAIHFLLSFSVLIMVLIAIENIDGTVGFYPFYPWGGRLILLVFVAGFTAMLFIWFRSPREYVVARSFIVGCSLEEKPFNLWKYHKNVSKKLNN